MIQSKTQGGVMDINHVILIGRLTRDAELKYTPQGKAMSKFSLAVNGYGDTSHFFDCTCWGATAEKITQYMTKGKQIAVEGSLSQNRWTDTDGKARSKVEINASGISLLSREEKREKVEEPSRVEKKEPVQSDIFEDDEIPF